MNLIQQQVLDLYDAEVAKHPEGIKVAEAIAAIDSDVRVLILASERDIDAEFRAHIAALNTVRATRSRHIKRDLDFILDYFIEPKDAALIPESRLDWAIRLGEQDGTDKLLCWWTPEDFINLVQYRRRKGEEVLEAAEELSETIDRVVSRLRSAGARHFGDVDWAAS